MVKESPAKANAQSGAKREESLKSPPSKTAARHYKPYRKSRIPDKVRLLICASGLESADCAWAV